MSYVFVSAVFLVLLLMNGALAADTSGPAHSVDQRHVLLKGRVSVGDHSTVVGKRVDELLDTALDRDPKTAVLDKAVNHYRTKSARVAAMTKDDADFLFSYRGFGPSSEAGDVITGEKLKLKSRAAAEYARQKHMDEMHTKIVSDLLQISMGLGMSDKARGRETVSIGRNALKSLVGSSEADRTTQMLSSWSQGIKVPDGLFKQKVWDVQHRNEMSSTVVKTALARDPVVVEIKNHIHKYNHLSKAYRATGRVVNTVLGVLSRTPAVHHGATPALVGFVTATGGPEQSKIMKELYLDQRFISRMQVISEETHMALDNYQLAVVTHNPALLACSESLIQNMAGPGMVKPLFGASVVPHGSQVISSSTSSIDSAPIVSQKPGLTARTEDILKKLRRGIAQRNRKSPAGSQETDGL